jgi:hypothetical protein
VVVLFGNVVFLASILCKKRGVSEESLLWVKGLGKAVVGYAISFLLGGFRCLT